MDATDIVDVVRDYVTLRKTGTYYKGLCPFHNEKTPSFTVSPSRQYCKCFSCGKGGNAVHFLMEIEHLSYPEAIKRLGKRYGIEVIEEAQSEEEREARNVREGLFVLNEWARDFFANYLRSSSDGVAVGMTYFRSRGFRDDIIKKFQLGFAPTERDALAKAALQKGYSKEALIKTGLCYASEDGKLIDRFHGRVIFPVHTVSGRVVAFGGRILSAKKGNMAKYVNSPESEIYSKSRELYGLFQSRSSIAREDCCYLVEGYTDVISMHQSGIENVVASSGTSLTTGQIHLLRRFTKNITVLYDGDSAGIKASLRGIDMLLEEGMNVKVLLLPDGEDPDSFARGRNAQQYRDYINAHQTDFIKFKTNLLLSECGDDPIKRAGLVTDIVRSISVIPSEIVRQMYARECAAAMSVSEAVIVSEIAKMRRDGNAQAQAETPQSAETEAADAHPADTPPPAEQQEKLSQEERALLALVVKYGERTFEGSEDKCLAAFVRDELETDGLGFASPMARAMLEEVTQHAAEPGWQSLPYFLKHPDEGISKLAGELSEEKYRLTERQQSTFVDEGSRLGELSARLLLDFKQGYVREQMKLVMQKIRQVNPKTDADALRALMQQYIDLSNVERQLAPLIGDRVFSVR